MSQNSYNNLWKPVVLSLVLGLLYSTVLAKLGRDWWNDENYSHGLLVPFVIGYIIWLEFENLKRQPKNASVIFGAGIVALAMAMLLAGTLGAELFVQRISLVVMVAGIVIYFFGTNLLKLLMVPFALFILAIPVPQIIFNKIAMPLQMWASQIAIFGIRAFGVSSVRNGNVIEILPQGAVQIVLLEVVEACSGIRSLMTLVTLGLVLWYFTRQNRRFDWVRALILMFAAIPIAILTNAGRVTATGVLTYYYGKQAADGFVHEFSGWLVYVFALILLIGVNLILKMFNWGEKREELGESGLLESFSWKNLYPLLIALILSAVVINWFNMRGEMVADHQSLCNFPATIGGWTQKGNDIRFSSQTESVLRTSDYVTRDYGDSQGRIANLYIGYYASQKSGATYHSPLNCLPGAGWTMTEPQLIEISTPGGKTFTANRYIIENGNTKSVLIYWYQGRGRAVASEYTDKIYTVIDSIFRQRSDGAMVRIMTNVGSSESDAVKTATDLSAKAAEIVSEFVPD